MSWGGNAWKGYIKEIILEIGASGFLGWRNLAGTDFSPVDLELRLTRAAVRSVDF